MIRYLLILFVLVSKICFGCTSFVKEEICHLEERVRNGCSQEVSGVRGLFECVLQCRNSCTGVTLAEGDMCYVHGQCPPVPVCAEEDKRFDYWSKYCQQGVWDASTRSCKCINGCFGERCERFPQSCDKLTDAGYSRGIYRIILDPLQNGVDLVKVVCDTEKVSKTRIVMLMNTGGMEVNRTWSEYVNGFYEDMNNFWGGLQPWYVLSNAGCDYIFLNLHFKIGESREHSYFRFQMTKDTDNNYKYTFLYSSTFFGSDSQIPESYQFGDCLDPFKNTNFSTWDNDNDDDPKENCAALSGSGWWYSGCDSPCNLLGWGLDRWEQTPNAQRLAITGTDMNVAHSEIAYLRMDIKC